MCSQISKHSPTLPSLCCSKAGPGGWCWPMDCEQKGHMNGQGSSELVGHFHLPALENLEAMCSAQSITRWKELGPWYLDGGEYSSPTYLVFIAMANAVASEQSPKEGKGVSQVFITEGTWEWHGACLSNLQITNFTSLQPVGYFDSIKNLCTRFLFKNRKEANLFCDCKQKEMAQLFISWSLSLVPRYHTFFPSE